MTASTVQGMISFATKACKLLHLSTFNSKVSEIYRSYGKVISTKIILISSFTIISGVWPITFWFSLMISNPRFFKDILPVS